MIGLAASGGGATPGVETFARPGTPAGAGGGLAELTDNGVVWGGLLYQGGANQTTTARMKPPTTQHACPTVKVNSGLEARDIGGDGGICGGEGSLGTGGGGGAMGGGGGFGRLAPQPRQIWRGIWTTWHLGHFTVVTIG